VNGFVVKREKLRVCYKQLLIARVCSVYGISSVAGSDFFSVHFSTITFTGCIYSSIASAISGGVMIKKVSIS
jgi:hypothetical protein